MTDKIQKIRKKVERLKSLISNNPFLSDYEKGCNDGREDMCNEIISIIDSLQKEPVSNTIDFEQELYKAFGQVKDFTLCMRIAKRFYDMGKKSQEPVSEDLGEYVNELSKQFPEVSFAKLSRIAVRVAKWQKEQMMKDAIDGYVIEDIEEGNGDFLLSCEYLPKNMGLVDKQKVKVIVIKGFQKN